MTPKSMPLYTKARLEDLSDEGFTRFKIESPELSQQSRRLRVTKNPDLARTADKILLLVKIEMLFDKTEKLYQKGQQMTEGQTLCYVDEMKYR